jgi:hypothetical protein
MTEPLRSGGRWSLSAIFKKHGDTFAWMTAAQRAQLMREHEADVKGLLAGAKREP